MAGAFSKLINIACGTLKQLPGQFSPVGWKLLFRLLALRWCALREEEALTEPLLLARHQERSCGVVVGRVTTRIIRFGRGRRR
jgi:hypothetical protein